MQPRDGAHGTFLGCSAYPVCAHMQKIESTRSTNMGKSETTPLSDSAQLNKPSSK